MKRINREDYFICQIKWQNAINIHISWCKLLWHPLFFLLQKSQVSIFLTLLFLKLKFYFLQAKHYCDQCSQVPSGFALTAQNLLFWNVGLRLQYDLHLWVTTVMCDHTPTKGISVSSLLSGNYWTSRYYIVFENVSSGNLITFIDNHYFRYQNHVDQSLLYCKGYMQHTWRQRRKKRKTTFHSGGRNCSALNLIILHITLGTECSNFGKKKSITTVYSAFYPIPGFDIAFAVLYRAESYLVVTCHAKQTLL